MREEGIGQVHERLGKFRQSVQALFDSSSWPTNAEEEWRRTDVSVFDFDALGIAEGELLANTRAERKSEGFFSLSDADAMPGDLIDRVFDYLAKLRDNPPNRFVFWNLLRAEDIFVLHLPAGTEDAAIHELCWHSLGEDVSRHIALIVLADEMSSGGVYLRLKGMEGHVQNVAAFYALAAGARLNVSVVQESDEDVLSFYQAAAEVERDAVFTHFEGILGGGFVKNRVDVALSGSGSELQLNGIYFAHEEQHIDMRTVQHHIADHANSRTFYKGVITDEAETIFQGLIGVGHGGGGTDAYLTNNNLILSDAAKADSIPSLNIETDDVKCSHGSTSGKIDEEQIYYFQCRGFSRSDAEELLIFGYFEELIGGLPERAQANVRQLIQRRFRANGQ